MVVLTLNMSSAPAGDYVVEYKLHEHRQRQDGDLRDAVQIAS